MSMIHCCRCHRRVKAPSPTAKYCRRCSNARHKEWYAANREHARSLNRVKSTTWVGVTFEKPITRTTAANRMLREEVITVYGAKCACCGETTREFLTIDHIEGGGGKHRKSLQGTYFYRWLKNAGFPKDKFQLLCYNCNCSMAHRGYCPHKSGSRPPVVGEVPRSIRVVSPEAKAKLRASMLGKKLSPATRKKISKALKGKPHTAEHVAAVLSSRLSNR